jgi:hypothetical protein
VSYEWLKFKCTKSQETASMSLESMLADKTFRIRSFLLVGEVGSGKSFLARKLSESRGYCYVNMVEQIMRIYREQNLRKMQPPWLVRYLKNLASENNDSVVIFDELESVVLLNRSPSFFVKAFLRIMKEQYFGKGVIFILSVSERGALPTLSSVKSGWPNDKLVILSIGDKDIQTIAENLGTVVIQTGNSFGILRKRIWGNSSG